MCDMTNGCDGQTGQLGRCKQCGEDRLDHEPDRFTGGAGSRTQPLSDEDYRKEIEKLESR